METDRGPRPGMRLLPLLFPSSSTAAGIYVVYRDHGGEAIARSLVRRAGRFTRSAASGHNTHSEDSGGRGGRAMDTGRAGGGRPEREGDGRDGRGIEAQPSPGVRPFARLVARSLGRSVCRSSGGLTNNEGRDGVADADADGARAVTTAMVTVWNAAPLPPPSLPPRSPALCIAVDGQSSAALCFCCHGE